MLQRHRSQTILRYDRIHSSRIATMEDDLLLVPSWRSRRCAWAHACFGVAVREPGPGQSVRPRLVPERYLPLGGDALATSETYCSR
jgi:hypothetical protein